MNMEQIEEGPYNKFHYSKIYRITNRAGDIYIGSTTQTLHSRFKSHKSSYRLYLNGVGRRCTVYNLFDKLEDGEQAEIHLIENYRCENRSELLRREGHYIKLIVECCNKNIAGRTKREHYLDNIEYFKQKNSNYYRNNKEQINARRAMRANRL